MTYQTVAGFSQSLALVLFLAVFLGFVVYAIWPANRELFERAARMPLQPDPVPEAESRDTGSINANAETGARHG